HFDGSYQGTNGEIGNASGVSFAAGRYDQGLLMDDADTLSYETAGNLNRTQGAIEFWVRPTWNGNDGREYVFFEAGAEWFNRMMIVKDGANNLRLMTWDSAQEYGVAYNIGHWRAGEWHHVAATWDVATLALYVDGQLVDRNAQARPPDRLADRLSIGVHVSGGSQVNATLDEFRISDIPRVGNSDTCNYRILVADSGNDRIQVFDGEGHFVSAYAAPGQFDDPQGLAVDDLGRVIVADRGNNRLHLLSFDGQNFSHLMTIVGAFNAPTGVWAYGSDHILVADTGNNMVKELILEGATCVVKEHQPPTPFNEPRGVAADRDGNLIVADTGNRRIVTLPGVLPAFTPSPSATPTTTPTPTPTPTPSITPTPTSTSSVTPTPTTTIPGSISGVVWHDQDGNGSQEPGEPGLVGVTIRLSRWDTEIAETQTAADGSYRFAPLVPGALYRVREAQPAGWRWSTTPDEAQIALANGQHAVVNFGDWNGRPTWLPLIVKRH
ncbi:MAG: LamG-like jellyroll fold domain-containing protein, partial [Anaerolineae bacterium]